MDNHEDLLKRKFTPVHQIVLGLSKADLREHLTLSTSSIDSTCSLGTTPLCWAALRTDPNIVRVLVESGSALHLRDFRGQSPVHFAAETGHIESLKVLLATAAQVNFPDPRLQRALPTTKAKVSSRSVILVFSFWKPKTIKGARLYNSLVEMAKRLMSVFCWTTERISTIPTLRLAGHHYICPYTGIVTTLFVFS